MRSIADRLDQGMPLKGAIKGCHQGIPPRGVINGCHQGVSSRDVIMSWPNRCERVVIQDVRTCCDPRGTTVSWSNWCKRVATKRMRTGRDRKDANRSGLKGCEQVGTKEVRMERNQRGAFDANHQRGVNHRTVEIDNRTPIALCREWTHMMAIGCRFSQYLI